MSQLSIAARRFVPRVKPTATTVSLRSLVVMVPLVVVSLLVLDYVFALTRPGTRAQVWLWTTVTMAFPIWFVGAALLLLVALTLLLGATRAIGPLAVEVALALEMTAYFFGTKIWPQTGDQVGWMQNAATPNLAASEPLADFVHKVAYWISGSLEGVRYTSPVFGVATVIVYLVVARRLAVLLGVPRWVLQAFLVASPLPFWYVTGYTENTFLAIPFLLCGLHFLIAYTGASPSRLRALVPSACAFAVAGLFHAGFGLMCAALAAYLLLRPSASLRRRIIDVALAAGVVLLVAALTFGLLALAPVQIVGGNTGGGYDGLLLTPFAPPVNDGLFRFTMLSHAHLIEVSNIAVHAAPALTLALPVVLLRAVRSRRLVDLTTRDATSSPVMLALGVTSCVYLVFIALWGFDLGPVGDLDLMLTMGVVLGLAVLSSLSLLLKDRLQVLAALLVLSGAINIAFYSMKVANVWAT